MGLDIYFEKRNKNADIEKYNEISSKIEEIYDLSEEEFDKRENELEELEEERKNLVQRKEVAYFRKVNFLMSFFDYNGNCDYKEISKEKIEELISNCKRVLAAKYSNSEEECKDVCLELLPTQGGFFFGNTEYGEGYFEDVKYVLEEFEKILEETDWDNDVIEMCAWW